MSSRRARFKLTTSQRGAYVVTRNAHRNVAGWSPMGAGNRWLTPSGVFAIGLAVLAAGLGGAWFATSGHGLALTVALACYAVLTSVFLVAFRTSRPTTIALLLLIAAGAAAAVHHGDPNGPVIGLYLVMALGPLRLSLRSATVVSLLALSGFNVELVVDHAAPALFILAVDGGAAFFFLLAAILRQEHEQRTRADRLLVELAESRVAERRAVEQAERSRLAREMHDVMAHTLSGLVLQLDGLSLLSRGLNSTQLTSSLDSASALARHGLTEARAVIGALRGDVMPGPSELRELVADHTRCGGICRLTITGDPCVLASDARVAIYRTAQEALSNVRKHAQGAEVDLCLAWGERGAFLVVQDSGGIRGNTIVTDGRGQGISGMAERAELLGGHLHAGPRDRGFRVELFVPAVAA